MHAHNMQGADERTFNMLTELRRRMPEGGLSLAGFKAMLREQCAIMLLDHDAAVAAIPGMLPDDPALRARFTATLRQVLEALGPLSAEDEARLGEIAALLGRPTPANDSAPRPSARPRRKAR
jgi:hypothetical protein